MPSGVVANGFLAQQRGKPVRWDVQTLSHTLIERTSQSLDGLVRGWGTHADLVAHGVAFRGKHALPSLVVAVDSRRDWHLQDFRELPDIACGLPIWIERSQRPTTTWRWLFKDRAFGGAGVGSKEAGRLGTLGCFVEKDGKVFGLTCEHNFATASNPAFVGQSVFWIDTQRHNVRNSEAWKKLGTIAETGGIDHIKRVATTDSALIKLECPFGISLRGIGRLNQAPMNAYRAVAERVLVVKYGAATQKTYGRVQGTFNVAVTSRNNDGYPIETVQHPNVLEIVADDWDLCGPGDSGAIFCEGDASGRPRAVGLLFATTPRSRGYAIPMARVLQHHGVKIF